MLQEVDDQVEVIDPPSTPKKSKSKKIHFWLLTTTHFIFRSRLQMSQQKSIAIKRHQQEIKVNPSFSQYNLVPSQESEQRREGD